MASLACPNCKKNAMRPWEGTIEHAGVTIVAPGSRCAGCGEVVHSFDEMAIVEERAAAELVKRGIRTGNEFRLVRKQAGFKATEIADLLGVRPETVSRWERGEVEIPRAAAFTLGELYAHPKATRQKLEAFA